MTMGQRIQQIRVEHGLSQEEFGEKLGTTRQSVSRWELDQSYPEISKIVLMSRVFSVTTDSILKDGISTFETEIKILRCGVYRSSVMELVETEKFALVYYSEHGRGIMGTKLYFGHDSKKILVAVCERNLVEKNTEYAYLCEGEDMLSAMTNSERLAKSLRSSYDVNMKKTMSHLESFVVDHGSAPLPTVKEAGIPKCLTMWRMADSYHANYNNFSFSLNTGKTDYIFMITPDDINIYCGASYNIVFDLGIFGGVQFFRLRNYKDNSEDFCGFYCDFSCESKMQKVPTEQCGMSDNGDSRVWCVKRYTDDEIVLNGCGGDEYVYRRNDNRTERFAVIDNFLYR